MSWANSLPPVIGIGEVLDFDLDFEFDPATGAPLDSSRDSSLPYPEQQGDSLEMQNIMSDQPCWIWPKGNG